MSTQCFTILVASGQDTDPDAGKDSPRFRECLQDTSDFLSLHTLCARSPIHAPVKERMKTMIAGKKTNKTPRMKAPRNVRGKTKIAVYPNRRMIKPAAAMAGSQMVTPSER